MTNNSQNFNSSLAVPITGAILFIVVAGWLVAVSQTDSAIASADAVGIEVQHGEEAGAAEAVAEPAGPVDLDAAIAAAEKAGCAACHTIPGIPNAAGLVGPDLTHIGADAAGRIDGYSAEEYIRESIAEPLAFNAPECPFGPCPVGAMPPLQLSDNEIGALVNYLVTLK